MNKYEQALRDLIADLDYDLFKGIERPEDGGPDQFPAIAEGFAEAVAASDETTIQGRPVLTTDIARMIADEVEGETNLVAGGLEWHIDQDPTIQGPSIHLVAEVEGVPPASSTVELVLTIESVIVR